MKNKVFPFWMMAATIFLAVSIIVFGISLYVDPSIFLDKIEFEGDSIKFIAHRWAGALMAIGISMLIALLSQSISMLKITMAVFCLMNLQDTIIGFAYDDNTLMVRSFLSCVLAAFLVFILNGMKPKRKRHRFLKLDDNATASKSATSDED
ncbi:MAG: hypothetical protein FGM54_03690 [Chitinophagaceae bacterium]|nr:hypothetical protein [Chitinophagaceae bacterium]